MLTALKTLGSFIGKKKVQGIIMRLYYRKIENIFNEKFDS